MKNLQATPHLNGKPQMPTQPIPTNQQPDSAHIVKMRIANALMRSISNRKVGADSTEKARLSAQHEALTRSFTWDDGTPAQMAVALSAIAEYMDANAALIFDAMKIIENDTTQTVFVAPSRTNRGKAYTVRTTETHDECDCAAGVYRGHCTHATRARELFEMLHAPQQPTPQISPLSALETLYAIAMQHPDFAERVDADKARATIYAALKGLES